MCRARTRIEPILECFTILVFSTLLFWQPVSLFRRLQFPQYVDDDPPSVEFCHVEVIHPIRGYDFDACSISEYIEYGDVLLLVLYVRSLAAAAPRVLNEGHGPHLVQSAFTIAGCVDHPLCQRVMSARFL